MGDASLIAQPNRRESAWTHEVSPMCAEEGHDEWRCAPLKGAKVMRDTTIMMGPDENDRNRSRARAIALTCAPRKGALKKKAGPAKKEAARR